MSDTPSLPDNIPKRGLSLDEAAEYLGISPHSLERHGPKPTKIGGRNVYDRKALDLWFDNLSGIATMQDPAAMRGDELLLEAIHARKNQIRHPPR